MKYLILGILVVSMLLFGCSVKDPNTSSSGISQAQAPALSSSVEQQNIIDRLKIMNSPSTTMWIYGMSDTGTMIFKSTVKGKVTSSTKRLEPATADGASSHCGSYVVRGDMRICSTEIIQDDGTYGSSDSYVFWFDYQGNYYQWDGKYILVSQPLRIPVPMIDFQAVNGSGG